LKNGTTGTMSLIILPLVYWKSSESLHHNRLWQSTISSAESERQY
jgi:hypothetical protein